MTRESEAMTTERIRAIASRALAATPASLRVELRPPMDIQSNRLYDVWEGDRHLIAKEFLKPEEWGDAPLREFQALHLLSSLDIAPLPVFYAPEAGPVVLYDFMEGQMWDRKPTTADDLTQLANLWLQMNSVPTDGLWLSRGFQRPWQEVEARFQNAFRAYADWAKREFPAGLPGIERCFRLLEPFQTIAQRLSAYTFPLCFCRADTRFANVIQRPDGRLGMIDWEDCGLRDPARDVAELFTHPNQEDLICQSDWQAFLRPYLAAHGEGDPTLYERTHLYLAIFPYFWLATCLKIGVERAQNGEIATWQINGMPANQRLQRYLARALAWPDSDFESLLPQLASTHFFPESG